MNDHQAKTKLLEVAHRLNEDQYRKPCLTNEQNTKNWLIVPALAALGWDISRPDVYAEDAGGVSGKVDYGLRVEGKVRVFIEAKALGRALDDKDAEQTSNYANNKGVPWCVLTNGRVWRVYKSAGAALHERLLFEVELEEKVESIDSLWQQLRYLSMNSVTCGDLDKYGNSVFIDNRLRDALNSLMHAPTPSFLNALHKSVEGFTIKEIRESITTLAGVSMQAPTPVLQTPSPPGPITAAIKPTPRSTSTKRSKKSAETPNFSLEQHLEAKPQHIVGLFHHLQQAIVTAIAPRQLEVIPKKQTVGFRPIATESGVQRYIGDVEVQKNQLKLYLRLDPKDHEPLPSIAKDVSNIGHWGNGNLQFTLSSLDDLQQAKPYIEKAIVQP